MTELEIIKHLSAQTDRRKFPFQLPNSFIYSGWECDFWTLDKDGLSREFEIKVDYRDFLNDAKKKKHSIGGGANYFYYVCPSGLIKENEIDKKYGLIYVKEDGFCHTVKPPRKRHTNLFDDWKMLANKMYWKWYSLWNEKYRLGHISEEHYFTGFELEDGTIMPE